MQDGPDSTSKALVHRWMYPEGGYAHFSTWSADKQWECIRACGLSKRIYRNKKLRIEVLTKLADFDLPLSTAAVQEQLTRRNLSFNPRYPTVLAKMLLDAMTGVVTPASSDLARTVQAPSSKCTAKYAAKAIAKYMLMMMIPKCFPC